MKSILLFLLAFILINCTKKQELRSDANIYKKDRKLIFVSYLYDKSNLLTQTDTIELTTSSKPWKTDPTQTKCIWSNKGIEITGILENDSITWIHPPRLGNYRILEFSPFPMIMHKSNKWLWEIIIPEQWRIEGVAEWSGNKVFTNQYELKGSKNLNTKLGNLNCYLIESKNESEYGTSYLKAYYNSSYGFIRLEYFNIDKSKIILELFNEKPILHNSKWIMNTLKIIKKLEADSRVGKGSFTPKPLTEPYVKLSLHTVPIM